MPSETRSEKALHRLPGSCGTLALEEANCHEGCPTAVLERTGIGALVNNPSRAPSQRPAAPASRVRELSGMPSPSWHLAGPV